MNSRTKLVTASAGVLLLAGVGGTLALWSDTADGDQLTAATGHLEVAFEGDPSVFDISANCLPTATATGITWLSCVPIDPAATCTVDGDVDSDITSESDCKDAEGTWVNPEAWNGPVEVYLGNNSNSMVWSGEDTGDEVLTTDENQFNVSYEMVPGDTIRVAAPITVDIKGKNIVAQLSVNTGISGLIPYTSNTYYTSEAIGDGVALLSNGINQFILTPKGVFKAEDAQDALDQASEGLNDGVAFYVEDDTEAWAVFDVHFLDFNNPADLAIADVTPPQGADLTSTGQNDSNGVTTGDLMNRGCDITGATPEEGKLPDCNGDDAAAMADPATLINVIQGMKVMLIQWRQAPPTPTPTGSPVG